MKLFIFIIIVFWIWIVFEMWRAPMMEETEDGGLITKKPTKKLSDLWRKRR
jgi:hypothetical protein